MTSAQFGIVQEAVLGRGFDRAHLTGPFLRLADAWASKCFGAEIRADVLALVAQVLRHERLTSKGHAPSLEVDLEGRGISVDAVEQFGLEVAPVYGGMVRIELGSAWAPTWLRGDHRWVDHAIASPGEIVFETANPIATEAGVPTDVRVPADPAVTAVAPEVTRYKSRAQAIALRAVAFAESGSTIHVVLPTGSGKSLVGVIPGLADPTSTTIVVVPTIALALDQEQQSRTRYRGSELPRELAYHGGRSTEEKRAMRERLTAGTQRLLFTSPESLVQSLARPLRELAKRGGLSYLVIDEAHLIYAWGTDFRPEFQLAASLVRELRALARHHSAPETKTVLMTATLSAPALRLNDDLFSDGRSTFVGTNYLRTELRYLFADGDRTQRKDRLIEAMRHCPKPAIVYTTRRQDAEELVLLLREQGFGRSAAFHGDVASERREHILRGWSGRTAGTTIDIVVATTAFGLGVDQADVRTVVHACIPRSVDRLYQEVGRAGRDGHTSISLWLADTRTDFATSRVELARLIGHQKGWSRWHAMRDHATTPPPESDYSMTIDLRTVPSHTDVDNDKNRLWNRNIVTVLRRAGVIIFAPIHPPELFRTPTESDAEWERRFSIEWENFDNKFDVTVAGHAGSLDEDAFEYAFQRVKREVKAREDESFERIRELIALEKCWGHVFADEYSLHVPELPGADYRLSASCSGCPACGHSTPPDAPPVMGTKPIPMVPKPRYPLMPALTEELMGRNVLLITYDPTLTRRDATARRRFRRAVATAVDNGIKQVRYSRRLEPRIATEIRLGVGTSQIVVVEEEDLEVPQRALDYPTLMIAAVADRIPVGMAYPPNEAVARLLLIPAHTPTPDRPHLNFEDVIFPNIPLVDLVRRI
jgi:ATP-dependent DNA helicase RecQ